MGSKDQKREKALPAILYLVIPCFNEEEVLEETAGELLAVMTAMTDAGMIGPKSRILFVDDGSRDRTWEILEKLGKSSPLVSGLRLRANAGHQNALYAGLMEAKDCCHMSISMDADLQDDPALIPAMVEKFYEGNDIVYAVRKSRRGEGLFKRASAFGFYRFMKALGVPMPKDCGDFRLMSREAMEALSLFGENRPFLRGLAPLLGFPSAQVIFDRRPRRRGRSKYSVKSMMRFAVDGVVSFSAAPIHLIFFLGIGLFLAAGGYLLYNAGREPGVRQILGTIWAAAGLVLMGIGAVGQYVVRIWREVTGRPRYLVRERLGEYAGGDEGEEECR